MDQPWIKSIIGGLKGHQEAILAFGLTLVGAALWIAKADPWVAVGLPLAIYVLYQFRMFTLDRHNERMAEIGIKNLEATKGIEAKRKIDRALAKKGS